jgi:amino acid adenylation domain-containing protein
MSDSLLHASVPAWFEQQARETPQAIAVWTEERGDVTYAELEERANRLAHRLARAGVGPEIVVAVCLERSLELIVGLLAIMKAGGAYLPIDGDLPVERQAFMLQDAQPLLILAERQTAAPLPTGIAPLLLVDEEADALERESSDPLPARITGENLAYVMYTSGSTGTPKGVEIPQRALVNFLASMQREPGLTRDDVLIGITTVSFDIAGLEIFLPLVTGAKLVFLGRHDAMDGFRILHHLVKHRATVLQATPSTWRMLLDAKWTGHAGLKMLCGGEGLPRDLATQLLSLGGELWNMYGPTETTIWSAVARVQPPPALIGIGRPVDRTQLYILDPKLQPVPAGFPGELHIGGWGLARGYRNRPELTAEKFIPDPFSGEPGARLYKTGDVARLRGGQIEIQGRMDHQVKIRGYRIELGEIEACLQEFAGVKESVVVAREIAPGRKQLVAYFTGDGEIAADFVSRLRAFLQVKLPDYMVPSFFEPLGAFPLTPNGKIDRKALPAPHVAQSLTTRSYAAPEGPVETKLAEIWSRILGRERIGRDDDIFEIGGDSLLIFRIAAHANEAALPVTVRQCFEFRTIAQLAAQVPGDAAQGPAVRPLQAVSREAFRRLAGVTLQPSGGTP